VPTKYQDEVEQDEGLALLIPDIQETANLVQVRQNLQDLKYFEQLYRIS
jgi:hypothetical protein